MAIRERESLSATSMAVSSSSSSIQAAQVSLPHSIDSKNQFFVWREFLWGGIAGAFGEGMMHPVDTIKTRIQSQAILSRSQNPYNRPHLVGQRLWFGFDIDQKNYYKSICLHFPIAPKEYIADDENGMGRRWIKRGVTPGLTGSLATGATYFGFIESTKKWIEESHPSLGGHWAHFIAGGIGDALGSFVYVPCEVIKQRMQVQGTSSSWNSVLKNANSGKIPGVQMYGYYTGMFNAGCSIWKEQGPRGLYAGYWSTLARDVPFAGLMVTFYEALKNLNEYGKKRWIPNSDCNVSSSLEGLLLGGIAGGLSAYVTTPLDVIKTRLQVQGSNLRYNGWLDAIHRTWMIEGVKGMFRGSIPRILWYVPASALTFMAVEFLRDNFNKELENDNREEVASLSVDKKKSSLPEVA